MKKLLLLAVIGLTAGSLFAGKKTFVNKVDDARFANGVKLNIQLTDSAGDVYNLAVLPGQSGDIDYKTYAAKDVKVVASNVVTPGRMGLARLWEVTLTDKDENDALNKHAIFTVESVNLLGGEGRTTGKIVPSNPEEHFRFGHGPVVFHGPFHTEEPVEFPAEHADAE